MTPESQTLPYLRQDLKLLQASPDEDGAPRWQLFDPLTHRFFMLSHTALTLFRAWQPGEALTSFVSALNEQAVDVDTDSVTGFIDFLQHNGLTRHQSVADTQVLNQRYQQTRKHWMSWLIHHYLFIKIPLLRPDAFFTRTYPKLRWVFHPLVPGLVILLGLMGLVMAVRQWESFVTTFDYFFSWQGMGAYLVALVFVKSAHEIGHAMVAKRYQCRISSMGLAFLVLFPVLYTDTTDAWRLKSKYQRLNIVTAGIRVELYLALLATFLWAFLPDGAFKTAAFFVATTSWVSSLLINISPFLRFDGYYALSDLSGVENLQPRAFAVGRWYLRQLLFGLPESPPEPVNRNKVRFFVTYAWATWVYRFLLFLGIALLVYHFAFKVLGIFLFVVEIVWFILLPIWRELKVWWQYKSIMRLNRTMLRTLIWMAGLLGLFFVPWQGSVSTPAMLLAEHHAQVYAPESAKIVHALVERGQSVTRDQPLLQLTSERLSKQLEKNRHTQQWLLEQLRRVDTKGEERGQRLVLQKSLEKAQTEMQALLMRREALLIRSPVTGQVVDQMHLNPGEAVGIKNALFSIVNHQAWRVEAYVHSNALRRLEARASGVFISDSGRKVPGTFVLAKAQVSAIETLQEPALASIYGGDMAVQQQDDVLKPEQGYYPVYFKPDAKAKAYLKNAGRQKLSGRLVIEAQAESWAQRVSRHVAGVLIKESGF